VRVFVTTLLMLVLNLFAMAYLMLPVHQVVNQRLNKARAWPPRRMYY